MEETTDTSTAPDEAPPVAAARRPTGKHLAVGVLVCVLLAGGALAWADHRPPANAAAAAATPVRKLSRLGCPIGHVTITENGPGLDPVDPLCTEPQVAAHYCDLPLDSIRIPVDASGQADVNAVIDPRTLIATYALADSTAQIYFAPDGTNTVLDCADGTQLSFTREQFDSFRRPGPQSWPEPSPLVGAAPTPAPSPATSAPAPGAAQAVTPPLGAADATLADQLLTGVGPEYTSSRTFTTCMRNLVGDVVAQMSGGGAAGTSLDERAGHGTPRWTVASETVNDLVQQMNLTPSMASSVPAAQVRAWLGDLPGGTVYDPCAAVAGLRGS